MMTERLDALLAQVIEQARSISVPVSRAIDPHVRVNTRARTRFGCCRREGGRYTIEVALALLEAEESAVCRVLAHEVLHTCPGCANHGLRWKRWAGIMSRQFGYDIHRTDSHEALGLEDDRPVRWLVVCRKCGKSIPRMKRSALVEHPERYRCRCGGALYTLTPAEYNERETSPGYEPGVK